MTLGSLTHLNKHNHTGDEDERHVESQEFQ